MNNVLLTATHTSNYIIANYRWSNKIIKGNCVKCMLIAIELSDWHTLWIVKSESINAKWNISSFSSRFDPSPSNRTKIEISLLSVAHSFTWYSNYLVTCDRKTIARLILPQEKSFMQTKMIRSYFPECADSRGTHSNRIRRFVLRPPPHWIDVEGWHVPLRAACFVGPSRIVRPIPLPLPPHRNRVKRGKTSLVKDSDKTGEKIFIHS